jgi:hypothetical protein
MRAGSSEAIGDQIENEAVGSQPPPLSGSIATRVDFTHRQNRSV